MAGAAGDDNYITFMRDEWAALRANTPLPLDEAELKRLRGLNEPVSLTEVEEVYLPLSRLLNLHVLAARGLQSSVLSSFLDGPATPLPYVIGIAGSVGVGKSTFARLLQVMLSRWPMHPKVSLIATDGFLHPTRVLEERGLMQRKGFPETYDLRRMLAFLSALKAGHRHLQVPVYSHKTYDIVPHAYDDVDQPDIVIFEGLNVLQTVPSAPLLASDFFDFSIYLDADTSDIEQWYIERFLLLQRGAFQETTSYFHHFRNLLPAEARARARMIWRTINLPNLERNILPTRARARLILHKAANHTVDRLCLRKI